MAEPRFSGNENPETVLQRVVVSEIRSIMQHSPFPYVVLERFGLDVSVFLLPSEGPRFRQIELKVHMGGRPGGVGFGDQSGNGCQVDLLHDAARDCPRTADELRVLDASIRWVLAYGLEPEGTARFAWFTCSEAKQAAMGVVRRGKQNNLRISSLENKKANVVGVEAGDPRVLANLKRVSQRPDSPWDNRYGNDVEVPFQAPRTSAGLLGGV